MKIVYGYFLLQRCKQVQGSVYCFEDHYPIPAFCFQVKKKADVVSISQDVFKLLEYFLKENIAHNIFITRGKSLDEEIHCKEIIRILVWPRKHSYGVKQLDAFNIAVLELSGYFPIYSKYNNVLISFVN